MKTSKPGSQGSFGIPPELMKEVNKAKRQAKKEDGHQDAYQDAESIPDEEFEENKGPKLSKSAMEKSEEQEEPQDPEAKRKEDEKKRAEEISRDLGIEITDDDLYSLISRSVLVKKSIVIFPGRLHATFQTLTNNVNESYNEDMGGVIERKLLEPGYRSIQTRHLLSNTLLEMGPVGSLRSLGKTKDERFKALGETSTFVLDKLSQCWNAFFWLIDYTLNRSDRLKNS